MNHGFNVVRIVKIGAEQTPRPTIVGCSRFDFLAGFLSDQPRVSNATTIKSIRVVASDLKMVDVGVVVVGVGVVLDVGVLSM